MTNTTFYIKVAHTNDIKHEFITQRFMTAFFVFVELVFIFHSLALKPNGDRHKTKITHINPGNTDMITCVYVRVCCLIFNGNCV